MGDPSVKGMCYAASERLYHELGGKAAGLTPMHIYHEGWSHWYLRWVRGDFTFYLDPTAHQFDTPVPWEKGTGRGFLTKKISRTEKARKLA